MARRKTKPAPALYVGVDPGANGGLACLDRKGKIVAVGGIPKAAPDLLMWFHECLSLANPGVVHAVLEQVGGYLRGNAQPGSAMFSFGKGVGRLEMAMTAAGIVYYEVVPRTWQKAFDMAPRRKGEGPPETKTQWKGRLRDMAQALFPGTKVTLAVADALMLAEYARRKHLGLLGG